MKDSGLPLLGMVPKHWELRKLRSLLKRSTTRNRLDLPLLSVVREKGVILRDTSSSEENHNFIPDDLSNYKVVRRGQFAMNKMKAWQGSYGVSAYDGLVSPAYFVFDLTGVEGSFFHAAIRSAAYVPSFTSASDGVRIGQWDLAESRMREIVFAVPPTEEQAAIVRFLDYADRRIRRYIRAKQKLIKRLEEQRRAIVHQAVTRGLDPNVRVKSSGIDSLGNVPAHWEVVRFKRRVGFQEGPGIMASDFRDAGTPLLRISCLTGDRATLQGCDFLDPDAVQRRWSHFAVRSGDYLLSASASTGRVVLATDTVAGAIAYTGILRLWSLSAAVFMPFVKLYIESAPFQAQIDAAKAGVAIEHFGPTHLKRMFIALPPEQEQRAIAAAVQHATEAPSRALLSTQAEVGLIREYRTRLVAAVITGKLDVREAAARLPDEIEDAEPLDDGDAGGDPVESGDEGDAIPEELEV
jgi:type I restriction enzyme S subunit